MCTYTISSKWHVCWFASILLVLPLLAGCQLAQPTFARVASDAGSTFSASSTTMTYVHAGKIPVAYASSSFDNYQSQLSGLDQQLPSLQGAPDRRSVSQLLALYTSAMRAVDHPCLVASCGWRTQLTAPDRASQAFLKAGGS